MLTAIAAESVTSTKLKVFVSPASIETSGIEKSVNVVVKQGSVTVTVKAILFEYELPVPAYKTELISFTLYVPL